MTNAASLQEDNWRSETRAAGIVAMRTGFGGTRIVDMLIGEQPPGIC